MSYRINQLVITTSFERPCVTAILGPRRVGKTYFVEAYARAHPERTWVFLNMDSMQQQQRIAANELAILISEAAKRHIGTGEKIWVIVDEAQKCPEIFNQIKILYDEYKNKLKFIITGSAVLSLYPLSTESLAGRIELYHLYPFTLREAALLKEPTLPSHSLLDLLEQDNFIEELKNHIHTLLPFKPLLELQLKQHCTWGGFPELLALAADPERYIYLNNYLQTYFEKDIRAIETITNLKLYRNLLDIVAEQTGSVRDDKRVTDALGCKHETLKKYRGFLEATLLYREVYPFIGSSLKRLVKSPKGYLLDNGLVSALTGISDYAVLQKSGLIGHRLENWFLNELQTWVARSIKRSEIYYWRTNTGTEVDFVVDKKPFIYPFEVTLGSQPERKKVMNLKTFLADEKKAHMGFYVYRGEFRIDYEQKIIFIPSWAVA